MNGLTHNDKGLFRALRTLQQAAHFVQQGNLHGSKLEFADPMPHGVRMFFRHDGRTNLLRNVLVDYVTSLDSTTYDHRHRVNLDLHQLAAFPLAPNCRMNYLTGVDLLGES